MKVYILWEYDCADDGIVAIFKKREDALKKKDELEKQNDFTGWLFIIEHEVQ